MAHEAGVADVRQRLHHGAIAELLDVVEFTPAGIASGVDVPDEVFELVDARWERTLTG